MNQSKSLVDLAWRHFDLSQYERCFLSGISDYKDISISNNNNVNQKLLKESVDSKTIPKISADLLSWLCTNSDATAYINRWGVRVFDTQIEGLLNLQFAKIPFPLVFRRCLFTKAIRLEHASVSYLDLSGTCLKGSKIIDLDGESITSALEAIRLKVEHHILLGNGFKANGVVNFLGANISGQLNCRGGYFSNPNGDALYAQEAEIGNSVILKDLKAEGTVSLAGAKIAGQLNCSGGHFINPNGDALNAQGTIIDGPVFLRNHFKAEGTVLLAGSKIGSQIDCEQASFIKPNGYALIFQEAEINESVFLRNCFNAEGIVSLVGSKIGGRLDCSNG